ncbi:hypothetical protein BU16DRAFT_618090 [Lophium mytilinum]|uniref:Amidohydrolase-related domain-containing protein n=1 Tax=Lophium mytilinum TaxID=390894 RepID=A0A6A6QWA5_9PEZI|nr:hypothetical protein BU16DRAFT_618090 [Lophium mytilinum]
MKVGKPTVIAITKVRVLDGQKLCNPSTGIIKGNIIDYDSSTEDVKVIDGKNGVLLPGLIDTHIHLHGELNLHQLTSYGVTTAFDMAAMDLTLLKTLREKAGLSDIRSAGKPATSPGSRHSSMPGYPASGLYQSPSKESSSPRKGRPRAPTTSKLCPMSPGSTKPP